MKEEHKSQNHQICNIFLVQACLAPPAVNGRISNLNGAEMSSDGRYPVGSRIALHCNDGYQRYGFYSFSDCVQPGIWAQPLTECIRNVDGEQNNST